MKKFLSLLLTVTLLAVSASVASASLLTVDKDGEVIWKVLSEQDSIALEVPTHSHIEVKKTTEENLEKPSLVSLARDEDKVSLVVSSENGEREIDVSKVSGDLIEIEERSEIQKLSIGLNGTDFTLKQKGITAKTQFPIAVDTKAAQLTVTTESGKRFLSILPYQIVETLLRLKLLTRVEGKEIEIFEEERELQYLVKGEKILDFNGLFEYSIPVAATLSASTGEIVSIEAPIWYKAVAYLIT